MLDTTATTALLTLRGLARLFTLQDDPDKARTATVIADSLQAGRNINHQMAQFATALETDSEADWATLMEMAGTAHEGLQATGSGTVGDPSEERASDRGLRSRPSEDTPE